MYKRKVLLVIWVLLTIAFGLDVMGNIADLYDYGQVNAPKRDLFFLVATIVSVILLVVHMVYRKTEHYKFVIVMWALILVAAFVLPEFVLRLVGLNLTYSEQNNDPRYFSPYGTDLDAPYFKFEPHKEYKFHKQEFSEQKKANSLGYIDGEWNIEKKKTRLLTLGDSFTEGVGAEKPWAKELQDLLINDRNIDIDVMNAGLSSHDPLMSLMAYRSELSVYKPDVVMLAINSTDIDDIVLRGCSERFVVDSLGEIHRKAKPHPMGEYLYAVSHTFRAIASMFGYNSLLMTDKQTQLAKEEAVLCLANELKAMYALAAEKGFHFVVVMHPMVRNIEAGNMTDLEAIEKELKLSGRRYVDLWSYYNDSVGINAENMYDHYWPIDRHQKDYRILAEGILDDLGCEYFTGSGPMNH